MLLFLILSMYLFAGCLSYSLRIVTSVYSSIVSLDGTYFWGQRLFTTSRYRLRLLIVSKLNGIANIF